MSPIEWPRTVRLMGLRAAIELVITMDPPLPLLDQPGIGGLDGVEYSGEQYIESVLPGLHRVRTASPDWHDARVGEHEVNAPEYSDALLEALAYRRDVSDITDPGDDLGASLLDQSYRLSQVSLCAHGIVDRVDLIANVQADDVDALAREAHRVGSPLSARQAGDEGNLVCQALMH